ncbi:glycine zipper domain-containing protein [Chitinophaga niabensis]|uniref:Glycine-zipper containing OmpA-like membrane domain-containing protein n=1 Tax=Chitinophaga niabensis TaxID=536979 RepID=A0A1N6DF21_9BACT|nr:glycine zipper domain-containing protein [Chitinophaga niabensis]SIN69385.1 Glycine-zipper containing OmpA-like membrane domain-containing protein [Chitinophaga niabensis]
MKNLIIIFVTTMTLAACNNKAETARAVEAAKKATLDSIHAINTAKQKAVDSMKHVQRVKEETAAADNNAPVANEPVAKKKKKWSHTAKGAVVGAAGGAITGAIVNKDRAKGAVIGTLIGAGAGAATGAIVDHNEKKKKKTAQ